MAKAKGLRLVSKSVQFADETVKQLEALAVQVGFTHNKGGVGLVGNVARIVTELVEFGLSRKQDYLQWKMNGKK